MLDDLFARLLDTNFRIVMMQRFPSRTRLDDIIGLYPVAHQVGHQMQL
jgi:predicted metalloprotease